MVIESVDNKKIKELRKLKTKKYRDEEKKFLVEGIHLVKEAYDSGSLIEVLLLEGDDIDFNANVTYVSESIMKSLSDLETPYNIIGICNYPKEKEIGNKVLMLDEIQDPGNLGTIIRSSVAFNIDTIILSKTSVDVYNSKVLRGCQGMNFHINIIRDDLIENIKNLKSKGYRVYTTDVNGGKELKSIKSPDKYVIIMGNEGKGVSFEASDLSDERIYINMNENCESLNVAVATSIILYEFK
ncbi:MAG: RNA methyltransferase [Bacilli bacterium]|nr:RNA methyltransferase [Bacilli bacterium]MBO6195753.1 RNA methyltransferase [Bacilli bacterium]